MLEDLMKINTRKELLIHPHEMGDKKVNYLSDNFGYIEEISSTNHSWVTRIFVMFHSSDQYGVTWEGLCRVSGPEGLRECRHTHFFNDGYIFYMSSENMRIMMDFLETKYDMDR